MKEKRSSGIYNSYKAFQLNIDISTFRLDVPKRFNEKAMAYGMIPPSFVTHNKIR